MKNSKKITILLLLLILVLTFTLIINKKENMSDKISCTISISCESLLSDLSKLPESKHSLVPEDGFFLTRKKITVKDGENAFNLLVTQAKNEKLHIDFANAPVGGSSYVKGIGNIYEGDMGELSGWIYKVNNEILSVGADEYIIKNGDHIEWLYSPDLLKEIN